MTTEEGENEFSQLFWLNSYSLIGASLFWIHENSSLEAIVEILTDDNIIDSWN